MPADLAGDKVRADFLAIKKDFLIVQWIIAMLLVLTAVAAIQVYGRWSYRVAGPHY